MNWRISSKQSYSMLDPWKNFWQSVHLTKGWKDAAQLKIEHLVDEFDSQLWSGLLPQLLLLFTLLFGFPFAIFALIKYDLLYFFQFVFFGPFLGNYRCRKLGPSIERFLVCFGSPSGRLPSSDKLACWLSRKFTFLLFSFLLLSIACWPWCCKNPFFVIVFLSVIINESSFCD